MFVFKPVRARAERPQCDETTRRMLGKGLDAPTSATLRHLIDEQNKIPPFKNSFKSDGTKTRATQGRFPTIENRWWRLSAKLRFFSHAAWSHTEAAIVAIMPGTAIIDPSFLGPRHSL